MCLDVKFSKKDRNSIPATKGCPFPPPPVHKLQLKDVQNRVVWSAKVNGFAFSGSGLQKVLRSWAFRRGVRWCPRRGVLPSRFCHRGCLDAPRIFAQMADKRRGAGVRGTKAAIAVLGFAVTVLAVASRVVIVGSSALEPSTPWQQALSGNFMACM